MENRQSKKEAAFGQKSECSPNPFSMFSFDEQSKRKAATEEEGSMASCDFFSHPTPKRQRPRGPRGQEHKSGNRPKSGRREERECRGQTEQRTGSQQLMKREWDGTDHPCYDVIHQSSRQSTGTYRYRLRLGGARRRGPGRHHPLGVAQPP